MTDTTRFPWGDGPAPVYPEPSPAAKRWIAHHRDLGHHPHPAPTMENPERWDCDGCLGIWRILTPKQVRQKFAHLAAQR